jgi:hypothetical protein
MGQTIAKTAMMEESISPISFIRHRGRGRTANCTVTVSDEEIYPHCLRTGIVVALNLPSSDSGLLESGGFAFTILLWSPRSIRSDIEVLGIDHGIAQKLKQVANMVLLGIYKVSNLINE